jgi:hypothetical protein
MSGFLETNLPLSIIYSDVYSNVSGQVLEIDKQLIPPGHLWSRLFATRVLIGDDYTLRGYITQKLIDLGYIAKAVYSPIIPAGFLFLQSYESATWFAVDAVEINPPGPYDRADDASFQTTAIETPPDGSIINFDITVPYGNWFILELGTDFALGMQIDDREDALGDPTFLYEKRSKLRYPQITVPLAIPNTQQLHFTTEDNSTYLLAVNDAGQLFWIRGADVTVASLFAPDGLFWSVIEPVLTGAQQDGRSASGILRGGLYVKASFSGIYTGLNLFHGNLAFQWRTEDIAELVPGTYAIPNHPSGSGQWFASGTLTVNV